jgi:hypothetical protein
MRHIKHDIVCPPVLDKGPQLIFQVLGLLSRETRYRKISAIPLRRWTVTILAVPYLGLKVIGATWSGENNGQDRYLQSQLYADDLH